MSKLPFNHTESDTKWRGSEDKEKNKKTNILSWNLADTPAVWETDATPTLPKKNPTKKKKPKKQNKKNPVEDRDSAFSRLQSG